MMICFAAAILLCFVLRFYLVWENRRRDGLAAAAGEASVAEPENLNMADRTDKEMLAFRYVY
jgi:hypothetical protein